MLEIRDFQEPDLAGVLRLNVGAEGPDPDLSNLREIMARGYRALLDVKSAFADGAFLVGLEGDAIVAMAAVRRVDVETFEMNFVRVAHGRQRLGFGRKIVEAVEARARALSAARMVLITTTRQLAAQKLYAALGYVVVDNSVLENENGRFELLHYAKDFR